MLSAAALLEATRPHLSKSLVSSAAYDRVHEIAAALPPFTLSFGLECRLAGDGPVDFGASVSPSNGGAGVLAGRTRDEALRRSVGGDARWKRLRDFALRWTRPRSPLPARIPFVFFEFDADAPRGPVPVPSVFLGLDWLLDELGANGAVRARRGLRQVMDAAEALRGRRFARDTKNLAARCFALLPARGLLLHAAVMTARPGNDLRFSVLVPRSHVGGYLAEIGRTESAPVVLNAIETHAAVGGFPTPGHHVQLDFDVGGRDRRIGLTLNPSRGALWPMLLRQLVESRLCERAKAEGLLRWGGKSLASLDAAKPPVTVVRWPWHVKLTCTPDGLGGAKAYFGAMPV